MRCSGSGCTRSLRRSGRVGRHTKQCWLIPSASKRILDSAVPAATHGVAIFAGDAQRLFETLTSDVPFENNVSALAMPDLFQLADLLTDREVAVVALAHTHAVRLLVTHRGGMREVRRLAEDPKFFHQVRSTNAMNQAHYQRHARQVRADFAREVATEIERLVQRTAATEVILGGDAVAIPILRQALLPQSARLAQRADNPDGIGDAARCHLGRNRAIAYASTGIARAHHHRAAG